MSISDGFDVTEDNIWKLKSKTFFGNEYKIGDHVNIVFIVTNIIADGVLEVGPHSVIDSEIPLFLEQYRLLEDGKVFGAKWMFPEN